LTITIRNFGLGDAYNVSAVISSDEFLAEILPEHFVLFKPRDIVSGDFYWIKQIKNFTIVVAADCTGHGVPGAFMSMLGVSMLNEIIGKSRLDSAGEFLDRLRKKVKSTLSQEGKEMEQKDGMDLSLAIFDNDNDEMQYAGAFNPIYIIRKIEESVSDDLSDYMTMESKKYKLFEIKGDRQPISIYSEEKEFKTNHIKLRSSDSLYMFSDGYPDQMGGPKGKKFMVKKFKELLLSIQDKSMSDQKITLDNTLEDWKSDVKQIDDILVFGIRWK
jgi:serine phosphatase RsbU (regulator of sigma subunit)